MSVGMLPLPVFPVRALSPDSFSSAFNLFASHTYKKPLNAAALWDTATTASPLESIATNPNSFEISYSHIFPLAIVANPFESTASFAKSFLSHTCAASLRNCFVCHTSIIKGLKVLHLPHFREKAGGSYELLTSYFQPSPKLCGTTTLGDPFGHIFPGLQEVPTLRIPRNLPRHRTFPPQNVPLLYWSFNVLVQTVPKLRISIVQYLNTAPLVWGFTNGPLHGKYDLDFTVPSQCAEALRSGTADIAIIPAIEYQRIDDLVVLAGFAIASKNRVRSLLLVSKKPIAEVQSIALDSSSRSTQALARILCVDAWKISPRFFEATPVAQEMLQHADAALLIGDPALRLAVAVESATSLSTGPAICRGASVGLPGHRTLYVYDMVEEWRNATGLPAVLAVWAARPDVVTAEVLADFAASRDFGLARIAEISTAASRELELSPVILASYLNTNIDFSLDGENRRGLEHFYARAAALNLIPSAKSINWATATASLAKLTL